VERSDAEPSDAAVIAASFDDPAAFATVFDRHAAVLLRFLVRRVGPDAADGLVGESFRIAFERRSGYDCSRPSARPWLYGIATNVLAKHRRAEARRFAALARLPRRPGGDPPPAAVDDQVIAQVDARELWPRVAATIAALPPGERDALLLYAWEDLGYEDIAAALRIPVGTVRSRLNRARRRLRDVREPEDGGGEQRSTPSEDRGRIGP
jgi:RNA polymerase sigma-70 factor (ECF subfamily)